jgi:hypothetical protein
MLKTSPLKPRTQKLCKRMRRCRFGSRLQNHVAYLPDNISSRNVQMQILYLIKATTGLTFYWYGTSDVHLAPGSYNMCHTFQITYRQEMCIGSYLIKATTGTTFYWHGTSDAQLGTGSDNIYDICAGQFTFTKSLPIYCFYWHTSGIYNLSIWGCSISNAFPNT